MNDRELLEAAAKAAGIKVLCFVDQVTDCRSPHYGVPAIQISKSWDTWNPLADDGDALRLAVTLEMNITRFANYSVRVIGRCPTHGTPGEYINDQQEIRLDPFAATRRAIVRAAALVADAQVTSHETVELVISNTKDSEIRQLTAIEKLTADGWMWDGDQWKYLDQAEPVLTIPSEDGDELETNLEQDRREAWELVVKGDDFSDFGDGDISGIDRYAMMACCDYFYGGWNAAIAKYKSIPIT
jgi:hypothetical protein